MKYVRINSIPDRLVGMKRISLLGTTTWEDFFNTQVFTTHHTTKNLYTLPREYEGWTPGNLTGHSQGENKEKKTTHTFYLIEGHNTYRLGNITDPTIYQKFLDLPIGYPVLIDKRKQPAGPEIKNISGKQAYALPPEALELEKILGLKEEAPPHQPVFYTHDLYSPERGKRSSIGKLAGRVIMCPIHGRSISMLHIPSQSARNSNNDTWTTLGTIKWEENYTDKKGIIQIHNTREHCVFRHSSSTR
jgi:hypothetical protein